MPKSKKDKEVTLTKVSKKGKEIKRKLVEEIRKCVEDYKLIFVFSFDNMRNTNMADFRIHFRDSRLFFGRNKVMGVALGRSPEDEYKENLHKISQNLTGQCALLFTNRPLDELKLYFSTYKRPDFARSGNKARADVDLEKGPLEYFPHSMEPLLRKLGLPVVLEKGVIHLSQDFTVCKKGDKLSPEQAKILKIFQIKLAEFRAKSICFWSKENNGQFSSLISSKKKSKKLKESSKKLKETSENLKNEEEKMEM